MIENFGDLLSRWTAAQLRADLGVAYETAASMKRRGSVAPNHWPQLIQAATTRGLTLDEVMLARFWRERKPQTSEAA